MKKIYVVGLGPGSSDEISPRAFAAIEKSDVIVGYDFYIELIKDIISGKKIFSSGMTKEVERCKKAAEYALSGRTVSVVSSGDSGIYGMAGIIYEVCKGYPQIEIEVVPGITAAVSAAAVLGAPIAHDFAIISLSDLLTDWEIIKNRILLASKADFVVCIYNPSSKKRADYLKRACRYMLEYKSSYTPCGYVKNIGRQGQECKICTLKELMNEQTDMFTTVIVGNSQTKVINGRLVTSRGYKDI